MTKSSVTIPAKPRPLAPTRISQWSQPRTTKSKKKEPEASAWTGIKDDKLIENLGDKIKAGFNLKYLPRSFQVDAIRAQLQRRDVLIHAGTGYGKTLVAAGPHALAETKGMFTIMVSPVIGLQEEQVNTFRDEFKLAAVAVNSVHGGCTAETMTKICAGQYQVVIISPELLLSTKFLDGVLRKSEVMNQRLLSVVVDEAHLVVHWGAEFRKQYARLGILRAFLPKGTPMVAMSATLPLRVRKGVLNLLQFDEHNFVDINLGNDRPNVSLVVRPMHHAMNTFNDLRFVIPPDAKAPSDIPKTFIYADSLEAGINIEDYLNSISPESIVTSGCIRPYSAAFSAEHRECLMMLFKLGIIRILICTDAAGMGCNIPDIDVVVQWKLPASVSSFVQRAGRAARAADREGLAVLLVERSVYDADLVSGPLSNEGGSNAPIKHVKGKSKPKGAHSDMKAYVKADKRSGYAKEHGIERGSYAGGKNDEIFGLHDVPLDRLATDEGLYTLAQTGHCRRAVLTDVFHNEKPDPLVPCCDLCHPELLNLTRPAPPCPKKRATVVKVGVPNEDVIKKLHEWRKTTWKESFDRRVLFGPSAILDDDRLEKLASVGPVDTSQRLKDVLGVQWQWHEKHGASLLEIVKSTPPLVPLPPKKRAPRAGKRGRARGEMLEAEDNVGEDEGRPAKRVRSDASTTSASVQPEAPTLVNPPVASPTVPVTPQRPYHPGPPVYNPYTGMYQMSSSPHPYAVHSSSPYPMYPVQYPRFPMVYPMYTYSYGSSSSNPPSSSTHPAQ